MPSSLSSAPELLREQVVATVIQPLEAASTVLGLGPRVFTAEPGQPVRVPKFIDYFALTAGSMGPSATYWVPENGLIGEDEPDWDELVLLPTSLKSIKVIHRVSAELARHSVVNVVQAIRDLLVRRVALAVDFAFLRGDGSEDTPRGLLNIAGRQVDSVAWSADTVFDAVGLLLAANATPRVWIMHPDTFVAARKWRTDSDGPGTGAYLVQPDPQEAAAFRLAGFPVSVTTLMPTDRVLLLDPTQVAVARDLDASVTVLSKRYAEYDQVGLRVVTRWDIGALNPAAIVDLTLTS